MRPSPSTKTRPRPSMSLSAISWPPFSSAITRRSHIRRGRDVPQDNLVSGAGPWPGRARSLEDVPGPARPHHAPGRQHPPRGEDTTGLVRHRDVDGIAHAKRVDRRAPQQKDRHGPRAMAPGPKQTAGALPPPSEDANAHAPPLPAHAIDKREPGLPRPRKALAKAPCATALAGVPSTPHATRAMHCFLPSGPMHAPRDRFSPTSPSPSMPRARNPAIGPRRRPTCLHIATGNSPPQHAPT